MEAADNSLSSDDSAVTNENETPPTHPVVLKLTHQEATLRRKELQRKKLSKKMRRVLEEYAVVVGEQASLICADSEKNSFRSYGTHPLTGVINKSKDVILRRLAEDLDKSSNSPEEYLTYLPMLEWNGSRVSIEEATQMMLRTLLPRLLKISSGCGRPGWGLPHRRPSWWPVKVLPWSNVRVDSRDEEQKTLMSWTDALRTAVINCYAYHGRLDLLRLGEETGEGQINKSAEGTSSTTEEIVWASSPDKPRYVMAFTEDENPQLRLHIVEDEQMGDETLLTGMNFVVSHSAGGEYLVREQEGL